MISSNELGLLSSIKNEIKISNDLIAIPMFYHNKFPYVKLSFGTPPQNLVLQIDTSLYHSYLFQALGGGDSALFNNTVSSTFRTSGKVEDVDNIYFKTPINGQSSSEELEISGISKGIAKKLKISDYGFILVSDYVKEDLIQRPEKFSGVLSLARDNKQKGGVGFSLMDKLYQKGYIEDRSIALVSNYKLSNYSEENLDYLVFGDEDDILRSFPGINTYTTMCNLYQIDNLLYTQWTCNLSHVIFGNDFEEDFNSTAVRVESNILFSQTTHNLIIPKSTKIFTKTKTSQDGQITEVRQTDIMSYLTNLLIDLKNSSSENNLNLNFTCTNYTQHHDIDTSFAMNYIHEENLKLESLRCDTTLNKSDFLKAANVRNFSLVINGYAYTFDPEDLFEQIDSLGQEEKVSRYYLTILFSDSTANYWIAGNMFMNKLKGIMFDSDKTRILFFNNKSYPVDLTKYTRDVKEPENMLFVFISVVCVISFILLALLIPYFFYRQRRRAIMERLTYDIIYRKVDDVAKDCGR